MTELSCSYGDDRDEAIVAFLYDEPDASPAERAASRRTSQTCARCQADVAALRGVRAQLARWSPPEPSFAHRQSAVDRQSNPQSAVRNPHWWRAIPAWAQVAAALLFLGVSAGIANLDVQLRPERPERPDRLVEPRRAGGAGCRRVGFDRSRRGASAADADAPWRADLAALEQQLKTEIRAAQASDDGAAGAGANAWRPRQSDADVIAPRPRARRGEREAPAARARAARRRAGCATSTRSGRRTW